MALSSAELPEVLERISGEEAATHSGCTLQSAVPMVVYHAHVWWNYAYKLTLHGEKPDMQFSFLLLSLGPRAVVNEPLPKGALKDNTPSRQTPPMARNVQLRIGFKNDNEFVPIHEGEMCAKWFTYPAIYPHPGSGSIVVEERNKKTLESVLAGKKCSNSDFIFTRGDSSANDATEYYVHKAPLAYTSITLHSIFNEKVSLPTDQILVESAQDRIIFPYLSDNDMKFLLTYLYTERVTLPEFNRFARVGRVISFLFDRVRLLSIFAQWQQLIIDGLLQIKENEKKVEYAMKSLIAVYSAPYGALPVAKRVAMSTLADQLMRQGDELVEKIKENEEFKKYSIEPILQSALKLKRLVAAVKKTSSVRMTNAGAALVSEEDKA
ncbi:unnamed protein product [Toxocara canis]|uniref:BTB domain-containing protein n=1 Tax=Toxocara canis TaxID=6265 RepID=A0A183V625_TOXCA|nr:unnamed protein product [Toxocara canis]